MASCITFQTQLTSIMEVLAKAAVAEIAKLVDDKCTFLHLEISRKQNENDVLKRKVLMLENKNAQMQRGRDNSMDRGGAGDVRSSCPHPTGVVQFAEIEDNMDSFTIKEERLDEALWTSDSPEPIGNTVQYSNTSIERQHFEEDHQVAHTEVTNQKAPNQFNDSHISGQRRDTPGGLQFAVKTEKEEDPSRFRQDGCQRGASKQSQLPPEFAMDERENQLWSSIIEGNDDIDAGFPDFSSVVEEYSSTFPDHSETQSLPAANKPNSVPQPSSQRPCNGIFNSDYPDVSPSTAFQPRPQVAPTQQQQDGQKEELFSQRNTHVAHLREPSEHPERDFASLDRSGGGTQPHGGALTPGDFRLGAHHHGTKSASGAASRGFICSLCGKTFSRLPQLKLHQQTHRRKRSFWCTVCGKSFQCSSHLSIHYRTHTGEKPYVCGTCGKRFTQQSSLRVHQRTHSGERPYSCALCGKTFILMHHLKRHRIIHTYS